MINIVYNLLNEIKCLDFEAFIIGGYTRDRLLSIESNDIDIVTNMDLDSISNNFNIVNMNRQFKNCTINYKGIEIDISMYRRDEYTNSRFPKTYLVNTIDEDILRRDFTINIVYENLEGKIFYPLSSYEDINNRIIRSVKDYRKSYVEDPLRMIRALKYSSKLNFSIINDEYEFIKNNLYLLNKINKNRILKEIDGIYLCDDYKEIIKSLL